MKSLKNLLTRRSSIVTDALDDLDQIREQIATVRAEIASVEAVPLCEAEAMQLANKWLEDAATDAVDALRLARFIDQENEIDLPKRLVRGADFTAFDTGRAVDILLGLVVATNPDAIRELISGQVKDRLATRPGMDRATRIARLAEARAQLFTLEVREELATRDLEDAKVAVERREDAAPEIVLATTASLEKAAEK